MWFQHGPSIWDLTDKGERKETMLFSLPQQSGGIKRLNFQKKWCYDGKRNCVGYDLSLKEPLLLSMILRYKIHSFT